MINVSAYANLNDALAACGSTFGDAGGELFLDAPTTIVSSADYFWHNLSIIGMGAASTITPTFDAGDYLYFGRFDGTEIRNIMLRDFTLLPSANRETNSGYAIKFNKGVRSTVENVSLGLPETGRHDGGFWFNGFDDIRVENCRVTARSVCLLANGMADQSYGSDIYIGGGSKFQNYKQPNLSDWQAGSSLIHLAGACGGVEIGSGDFIYGGVGLLIDNTGAQNREVFLNGPWFDSCAEDGIRVQAASVGTLDATGTWVSSCNRANNGSIGVRIQPSQVATMEATWTGGRIFNNSGDGIDLNGGSIAISGASITDNKGWGINAANSIAKGTVAGCNIGRNTAGTIHEISPGQLVKTGNRTY